MKNIFKAVIVFAGVFLVSLCMNGRLYAGVNILYEGPVTDIYGVPSGSLYFVIYEDGTMRITGCGQGASYRPFGLSYEDTCPWNDYRQLIKRVVFDCSFEGTAVPSIGGGASINGWFWNCENILEVSDIPEGITDMSAAFYGCTSLTCVLSVPETVKTMQYTFWNCSSLSAPPGLPASLEDDLLTQFENYDIQFSQGLLGTFHGCTSLAEAPDIPAVQGLYKMVNTFEGCTGLELIKVIPSNITYFQATFKNCGKLTGVMEIKADKVSFMDGVFEGAASENPYVYFIKSDYEGIAEEVLAAVDETSRVYPWNGDFKINFMFMNTVNNGEFGLSERHVSLRYGCDFQNTVISEYRSFICENFGNMYNKEYDALGVFAAPSEEEYRFDGWFSNAVFEKEIMYDELINPTGRELKAGEMTLYAKMEYTGTGCKLTINPNGGVYEGKNGITVIEEFEDRAFRKEFFYTGNVQEYRIPISGIYTITLYGAQGGAYDWRPGGYGGMMETAGTLQTGEMLYFYVGGGGSASDGEYSPGGFNGGGDSVRQKLYTYYDDELEENVWYYDCCGGGGGATDVRLGSTLISARIAAAGGGGGAGRHNYQYCSVDNPEMPNTYYDDDDDPYDVYDRTVSGSDGQGGSSAAGGGGGIQGGAHNYAGESKYGRANSSYGGTNGYDKARFTCLTSSYHTWGDGSTDAVGKNGYASIAYSGVGYEPYVPVRDGFLFEGWELAGDACLQDGIVYMSSGSAVITAIWKPVDYFIYFDAMEGECSTEMLRFWVGSEYGRFGVFPVAYREGCSFTGWYTQKNGGERVTEGMIAQKGGSVTLYAHYQPQQYIVDFDVDGGMPDFDPITVQAYMPYGSLPLPVKTGHRFLYWKNEKGEVYSDTIVMIFRSHTLSAVWERVEPPRIEGSSGDGEWRNTPVEVDYKITSEVLKEITSVVVSVESNGEEKVLLEEYFQPPYVDSYYLHMVIGDAETGLYEGITNWTIMASDSTGNLSKEQFTIKLDYTPPVIGTELDNAVRVSKEYLDAAVIVQEAYDSLSGIAEFSLTPGSLQGNRISMEVTPYITEEPFQIIYDTDRKSLENEAAYVLKAEDKAGNVTEKIIFTVNSVSNTILRTVPRENYD